MFNTPGEDANQTKRKAPLPAREAEFIGQMMGGVDTTKFVAADYDL